jgi:N,N'-diacetyllegionaminate synthase
MSEASRTDPGSGVKIQMQRCYIIAEAGVNHCGSEKIAFDLIDAAASAGADAVKFQTFRAENLVTTDADKAPYQKKNTGDGDQFSMLKSLELSDQAHFRLAEYCGMRNIEFMSTGFDEESVDFLINLGIRRIKVPSGELTNLPFIHHLATKNIPMIISTGMATLDEVAEAVSTVKDARTKNAFPEPLEKMITLLHCTSNYPASFDEVNLRAMQTLAAEFGVPVGYSDHTLGILVSPLAVAMGATLIEKHFTLDKKMEGPDHAASLEPGELSQLVSNIRATEVALGSAEKKPTDSELKVRTAARRSIILKQNIPIGHILTMDDLILLRPGNGIPPRDLVSIIGLRVKTNLSAGHLLVWDDLEK